VTAFGDNLIANVHPAEEENDPNRELGTTDHLVIPALRNAAPGLIALVRAYAERDVAYDAYHTVKSEPHGELSREEITDRYLSVNAAYLAAEKTLDAALTAFLEGSK
jgi:hypothetical protein